MKPNQNQLVNISILKSLEPEIKLLLNDKSIWKSLDIDYFPPIVERLYCEYQGFRIFLHVIHLTENQCLFHKHRWPAAFKQLKGAYEMGITYSELELSSNEVYNLPVLARIILNEGSYYEMTQTDCLHYVKPITEVFYSLMITNELYPEAIFRKGDLNKKLDCLKNKRVDEILTDFKELL